MLSAAIGKTEYRAKGVLWVTLAINTETLRHWPARLAQVLGKHRRQGRAEMPLSGYARMSSYNAACLMIFQTA
jgi:hypothetical protein